MKDSLYLAVFALGMLFFWLSGHAGVWLSTGRPGISYLVVLALAAVVYTVGLILAAFLWASRRPRPLLIGAAVSLILTPVLTWIIGLIAAGRINSAQDLGIYNFVLYLIFGALYVVIFELIRRLGRPKTVFDAVAEKLHNR